MADTERLVEIIHGRGIKKCYIADRMGIDRATLDRKLKKQSDFTVGEINSLVDAIGGLPSKTIMDIFFT